MEGGEEVRGKEHMPEPYEKQCFSNFKDLNDELGRAEFDEWWVFRAQPADPPLKTTLERCCEKWELATWAHEIEEIMIREFRRVYEGEDLQTVRNDTLYCLSLLRHYGAPARLLDFTYSKYVALYFGLEYAYESGKQENTSKTHDVDRSFAIWCINTKQLTLRVRKNYENCQDFLRHVNARADVETRDDCSFIPLYMKNEYNLAISESPAIIHKRHHLQQSVFLCPGNVKVSFMDNLLHVSSNTQKLKGIKKFTCKLILSEFRDMFEEFRRMNITRESLFPGLDGLAQSMKYQACFYKDMYERIKQGRQGFKELE